MHLRLMLLPLAVACSSCAMFGPDSVSNAKDANEAPSVRVSQRSSDFIVEMADARMMDYQEGKLASERSTVPEIQAYGQRMMTDQALLLKQLRALAAASSVTLPTTISASKQDGLKSLMESDAGDFDRNFIRSIRIDHERDVGQFEKATAFEDVAVSRFAVQELPMIQSHLDGIKAIDERY